MKAQSACSAIIRGSSADTSSFCQDLINPIDGQQRRPRQKRVRSSVRQQSSAGVKQDKEFKNKDAQIKKAQQQLQSVSEKQRLRQFIEQHKDDLSDTRNIMAKIISSKERFSMAKEEERSAITRQAYLISEISALESQLQHSIKQQSNALSSPCSFYHQQAQYIRVSSELSIKSRQLSNIRAVEAYLIDQFENSRVNLEDAFDQISKLTEDPDTGILSQFILDAVGFCGAQVFNQLTRLFKYTQMNEKITFQAQPYVYYTSTCDLQVLSVISKLQLLVIEQMQCNFNRLEKKYNVQSYLQSILLAYDYSNRSLAEAFRNRLVFAKHKREYEEVEEDFTKSIQQIQQEMNAILESVNSHEFPKLTMFLNQYATFQPILEMFFKDFLKMNRSEQERLQNLVIADLKAKHVNFLKIVNIIESNESTFKQLTNILTSISVTMLKTHCFGNETELLVQEIELIKESQRRLLLELETNKKIQGGDQDEEIGIFYQKIIDRIKELEQIRQRNQQFIDEELKGNIIAFQLELRNGQDKLNQMFKETLFQGNENDSQVVNSMINSHVEYAYELLTSRRDEYQEEGNGQRSSDQECTLNNDKQLQIRQDNAISGITVEKDYQQKIQQQNQSEINTADYNNKASNNNHCHNEPNEEDTQHIVQFSQNIINKNTNTHHNSPILIIDSPASRKIKSRQFIDDHTSNSSNYLEGSTLPSDYLSHDRTNLHNGNNHNNVLSSYNCQPFMVAKQHPQQQYDGSKVGCSQEFEWTFNGYEKAKNTRSFFKKQRYSEENPLCTKQQLDELYSIDLENARRKADELLLKNQFSYDSDQYQIFASSLDKLAIEDKENKQANSNGQQYDQKRNIQGVGKSSQRQLVAASFEKRKSSISQAELIKQQKKCFAYCQKTNKSQQLSNQQVRQQPSKGQTEMDKTQKRKEFKVMFKTKNQIDEFKQVILAFGEEEITLEGYDYSEAFQAKNIQQVVVPLSTLSKLDSQNGIRKNTNNKETRIMQEISMNLNKEQMNHRNNELYCLEITVMNRGICQIAVGSQRHFLAILTRFKLLFQ